MAAAGGHVEEGDAGLGAPVWAALAVLLLQVVLWLVFGFSAMFWPSLLLTPLAFVALVRFCSGRI